MTSTAQTSATHPPILKAIETEDGITLYSWPAGPGEASQAPTEARVIAQLYTPDHPDYAWARTILAQAEPADGHPPV